MKKRRVINIDKEKFDIIKRYCEKNAYDMCKWMPHIAFIAIKGSDPELAKEIEQLETKEKK